MRQEEVRECCEGWLQEASVPLLCKALGLGATPAAALAPLVPQKLGGYPSAAAIAEEVGEAVAEEPEGERPLPRSKVKAKAKAKRALKAPKEPSKELSKAQVEVSAQVSRFHKEAVEDEITSAVAEVDVHGLCISVAGRELLKEAHLKLSPGQRYGFVGRNGAGKSTLFRSMAEGKIPGYPPNCVTLLVDQDKKLQMHLRQLRYDMR